MISTVTTATVVTVTTVTTSTTTTTTTAAMLGVGIGLGLVAILTLIFALTARELAVAYSGRAGKSIDRVFNAAVVPLIMAAGFIFVSEIIKLR